MGKSQVFWTAYQTWKIFGRSQKPVFRLKEVKYFESCDYHEENASFQIFKVSKQELSI